MEKKVLLVCIMAGFLAFLSAILAFAAEAKRLKPSDVEQTTSGTCIYPRSPAAGLGLTAGLALVLAQAIITTAAGCICCKKHSHLPSSSWNIALVCSIISWVTFIIAFLLLLTGAALNDQHGEESMYFGYYCYVVKAGVFSGGAVLSLASIALGITYYLLLQSTKRPDAWGPNNDPGIVMAQPQDPPPESTQPVFVHEDTYNRLQFP